MGTDKIEGSSPIEEIWVKAGYTDRGQLIQYNRLTHEIRTLDKWVEIFKVETNESATDLSN